MLTLKDLERDGWESGINQVIMADCLEAMKLIPDKSIDLILTDPPYGIGEDGESNHSRSNLAKAKQYTPKNWDRQKLEAAVFGEIIRISKNQIIFGANHFISNIPYDSSCWIVWDKDNGDSDFADCELAWTSFKTAVRKFRFRWAGMLQEDMKHKEVRHHPTQKPTELMRWVLENYSEPTDLICDPFMGSWTTARACKDLGRNFIGFELEEDYCKVGEGRLRQGNLF